MNRVRLSHEQSCLRRRTHTYTSYVTLHTSCCGHTTSCCGSLKTKCDPGSLSRMKRALQASCATVPLVVVFCSIFRVPILFYSTVALIFKTLHCSGLYTLH
jgi:hypothetical protein